MSFSNEIYKIINQHKYFNQNEIKTSYQSFNKSFYVNQNKFKNKYKNKKYLNHYLEYLTHIFD